MAVTFTVRVPPQTSTLTDFPLYVDLSTAPAGFWSTVSDGGADIRCYAEDGTTELPREVVSCVTASDTGELWVKVTLSSTDATYVKIDTDGTRTEPVSGDAGFSEDVWSDYEAVLHLDTGSYTDSTGNGHNGTASGTPSQTSTNHPLGGTWTDFDGISDALTLASSAGLLSGAEATVQFWASRDGDSGSDVGLVGDRTSTAAGDYIQVLWREGESGNPVAGMASGGGYTARTSSATSFNVATKIDFVVQSAAVIYKDGTASSTDSDSWSLSPSRSWKIGTYYDSSSGRSFNGKIGAVRLRNTALSEDWIAAEYENQSNPTAFYSVVENHKATVTIPGANVSAEHANFPVYVDLSHATPAFWDTVADGGGDIRCYLPDGTELPREVVSCDIATDTGELHVKIDPLNPLIDNVIELHVDGVSSDYASTATYGAENVWTDYAFVSHDGGATESSGAGGTRTDDGGVSAGTATGNIGSATEFDGTDDRIDWGDIADISTDIAITAWIKPDTAGGNSYGRIIRKGGNYDSSMGGSSTSVTGLGSGNATITASAWNLVQFRENGTNAYSYSNGVYSVGGTSNAGAANADPLVIGNYDSTGTLDRHFDGLIGEVRVRDTNAGNSATDWHKTEYDNQNDPFSFYEVTTPQSAGTHVATVTIDNAQVTANHTNFPVYVDLANVFTSSNTFDTTVAANGADIRVYRESQQYLLIDADSEYVTFGSSLSFTGDFKLMLDFEHTTTPATDYIFGQAGALDNHIRMTDNSTIDMRIGATTATGLTLSTALVAGERYQLYFVRTGTTADVQDRDGNSLITSTGTVGSGTATFDYIGRANNNFSGFYQKLFAVEAIDAGTTVSQWEASASSGSTLSDYGTDQNDGTITGATFTTDIATELPREIVSCDTTANTGEMHVLVDYLSDASDTELTLYCDGAGDYPVTAHMGAQRVWTDYFAVYHGDNTSDSTSNGNDLTAISAPSTDVSGKMGSAFEFDGTDDLFYANNVTGISAFPLMLQLWAEPDAAESTVAAGLGRRTNTSPYIRYIGTTTDWRYQVNPTSGTQTLEVFDAQQADTWQSVSILVDSSSQKAYFNGTEDVTASATNSFTLDSNWLENLYVGAFRRSTAINGDGFFDGKIDEVRYVAKTLSSTWITDEHTNQATPLTFYTVTDPNGGGNTEISAGLVNLTLTPLAAGVNYALNIDVGSVSLSVAPQASSVSYDRNIDAGTTTFTISNLNATVDAPTGTPTTVDVSTVNITVTTQAAEVAYDKDITTTSEALTVTTQAATVSASSSISVDLETLTVTTQQAVVSYDVNVDTGTVNITLAAPNADVSDGLERQVASILGVAIADIHRII